MRALPSHDGGETFFSVLCRRLHQRFNTRQFFPPFLLRAFLSRERRRTHCHQKPSGSTNSAIKGYVIKSKRSKPKPIKTRFRKQIDIRAFAYHVPVIGKSLNSARSCRPSDSIREINSI